MMADLVYQQVITDLNKRIMANEFVDKKLPDERSLSEQYQVSRSSIKRALNVLANQGLIFKKRGWERLLIHYILKTSLDLSTKAQTWESPTV